MGNIAKIGRLLSDSLPIFLKRFYWTTHSLYSFLLIYFTSRHVCYYMSFQEMMKYWNRAKEGGVKHFKYEELDIGFFVPLKQGMILHYLECLQKVLEQKDQ